MGAAPQLGRTLERQSPRVDAYVCTDLCSEREIWTGLTMNISEGGLFVATHVILPIGTYVSLHLEIAGTRILTLGEVRWARAYTGDDDVPPGLGVRFIGLPPEATARIADYVKTATPLEE